MVSLVEHGRIRTTVSKAKELRRHIERAITIGKGGDLAARRLLTARIGNDDTAKEVVQKIAVRFKTRKGGYTRITKLGARPGDGAEMAYIEFVDYTPPEKKSSETVTADPGLKERMKLSARKKLQKRKTLRKLQSAARRVSR
jgi:large subunit ribosomal protein L17